jgi:hypothetical protein
LKENISIQRVIARRDKNARMARTRKHQPETPNKPTFPPKKQHVNLDEYLKIIEHVFGVVESSSNCFEDANHLYFVEYGKDEAHLTFAMSKNLYCIHDDASTTCIFDFNRYNYDARFILGPDVMGEIQFGIFKDNNLGQLFYYAEPKDSTHMLLSLSDHKSAKFEWLQAECEVKHYHYYCDSPIIYVVLPMGARFDKESKHTILCTSKADEDREFFQKLFLEELHHFIGDRNFPRTKYKYVAPPPTREQLAARAEANKKAEEIRMELINKSLNVCELLAREIYNLLEGYGLRFRLFPETTYCKNTSLEVVRYELYPADACCEENIFIIFATIEAFLASSPETIANYLIEKTAKFLDDHKDVYEAFKKIYVANKAYHDFVNCQSIKPRLNYQYIFGTTDELIDSFIDSESDE